jgi:hypothetical protein
VMDGFEALVRRVEVNYQRVARWFRCNKCVESLFRVHSLGAVARSFYILSLLHLWKQDVQYIRACRVAWEAYRWPRLMGDVGERSHTSLVRGICKPVWSAVAVRDMMTVLVT